MTTTATKKPAQPRRKTFARLDQSGLWVGYRIEREREKHTREKTMNILMADAIGILSEADIDVETHGGDGVSFTALCGPNGRTEIRVSLVETPEGLEYREYGPRLGYDSSGAIDTAAELRAVARIK